MAGEDLAVRAQRVTRFVEEYALVQHRPELAADLLAMSLERPVPWLLASVEACVERFRRYHEQNPFVTAPAIALSVAGLSVLRQEANAAPIALAFEELSRNVGVIGSSGSGKTALLLQLAEQALRAGVHVLIVDVKGDYRALAARHEQVFVLDANAPIDLLAVPPYLSRTEHIAIMVEALARALWGGQALRAVAHEAFTRAYEGRDRPTWQHVFAAIDALPHKALDRRTAISNLTYRLRRLLERYLGIAAGTIPAYELSDQSVLWSFLQYGDLEDFLVTYTVQHLFHHHRAKDVRALRTMIFFDEVLLAFREDQARIAGNPLVELQALTREQGISWAFSANAASELHPSLLANVFALLALNVSSSTEADLISKTCGFTPRQREYYQYQLTRGQAVVRLGDRWRKPMLARFAPWPHAKTVSPGAWSAACARITRLAPLTTSTPSVPTERQPTSAPSPAPLPPTEKVALNAHTTALLHDVADHPFTLCTPSYRRCHLLLAQGDRARAQAQRLGLLEADRVTTGRGRGKTGISLHLTAAGWEWVGRPATKGLRGGSGPQHAHCVFELARRIPGAHIEEQLADKSVDLAIAFNAEQHEPLYRAMSALTGKTPTCHDGDVIAIEVDTSRKTAIRNAIKNAAAGVALTLLAVDDHHPERLARHLPDNGLVVDVFALLDALKEPI